MADVVFKFETPDKKESAQKAQLIQDRLKQLQMVEDAEALPDEKRIITGLEIVGVIAVGVAIAGKSREFIVELRKLIPEIKKLAEELGLKNAAIEIEGKQVPLAEVEKLTDEKLQQAAS